MIHNSDFKYDLQFGIEGESMFAEIVKNKKVEVKRDRKAHITGNIFIEYECRNKPSGISITESDFYAYFVNEVCILIEVHKLKDICRQYLKTKYDIYGGDNNTSKGILLPIIKLFVT